MFERQGRHALWLAVLLAAVWASTRLDGVLAGSFAGVSTGAWLAASVAAAVVHQVYVVVAWRLELHRGSLSRVLGKAAFPLYAAGFTVLILARPLLIVPLAIANRGTLPLAAPLLWTLAGILAIPALYAAYSVARYFGFRRAFGADHFDPRVAALPPVREGIYRWTSNAMYAYVFLLLWIPALLWASKAAALAAAFQHAYIWVHAVCTEFPDLRHIHGADTARESTS